MRLLDGARWRPSPIWHPVREATWGIVVHWTAGHRLGDIAALTGGHVDVQFYVTKTGEVYQFVDADREAWHAFHTANHYCVGIEHEGSGEAWTPAQLKASARLARWVCDTYDIPVRHVDPPASWRGLYGHKDLAHIDGNDHTDTVPAAIGWDRYLKAIRAAGAPRLVQAPYWAWLQWRLGEGRFKRNRTRPANWRPTVPASYWRRLRAFTRRRK